MTPPASRSPARAVSSLPLRIRFGLLVGVIVAGVGGLIWLSISAAGDDSGATGWLLVSGLLVAILLVDQAARWFVYRSLTAIRGAMQRAAAGDLGVRVPVGRLDEIGVVARGVNDILSGVEQLSTAADLRLETANQAFRQQHAAITDSHHEMARLSEKLARAGRLAALGQAAANMAHQIGTPLNLISGYVQLLIQSAPRDSATLERLHVIRDQVEKVIAIVRTGLDSARPVVLATEPTDLRGIAARVCLMAEPLMAEANVEVRVTTSDRPAVINADVVQLELALLNLISNSIDAMPSGGVLTLGVTENDGQVCLEVEDTGSGIAPEVEGQLFTPWVTTKPLGKGSGLGLSIAQQIIVAHGGTIRAANRPDRGAIFTIVLPAAERETSLDEAHAESPGR